MKSFFFLSYFAVKLQKTWEKKPLLGLLLCSHEAFIKRSYSILTVLFNDLSALVNRLLNWIPDVHLEPFQKSMVSFFFVKTIKFLHEYKSNNIHNLKKKQTKT